MVVKSITTSDGTVTAATGGPVAYADLDRAVGVTADADGATVTFDLSASPNHAVTLGGNRTLAVSNDAVGQTFVVILKQDATGGRTVAWWAGISWPGNVVPTLTAGPNRRDAFSFLKTASGAYIGWALGQNLT